MVHRGWLVGLTLLLAGCAQPTADQSPATADPPTADPSVGSELHLGDAATYNVTLQMEGDLPRQWTLRVAVFAVGQAPRSDGAWVDAYTLRIDGAQRGQPGVYFGEPTSILLDVEAASGLPLSSRRLVEEPPTRENWSDRVRWFEGPDGRVDLHWPSPRVEPEALAWLPLLHNQEAGLLHRWGGTVETGPGGTDRTVRSMMADGALLEATATFDDHPFPQQVQVFVQDPVGAVGEGSLVRTEKAAGEGAAVALVWDAGRPEAPATAGPLLESTDAVGRPLLYPRWEPGDHSFLGLSEALQVALRSPELQADSVGAEKIVVCHARWMPAGSVLYSEDGPYDPAGVAGPWVHMSFLYPGAVSLDGSPKGGSTLVVSYSGGPEQTPMFEPLPRSYHPHPTFCGFDVEDHADGHIPDHVTLQQAIGSFLMEAPDWRIDSIEFTAGWSKHDAPTWQITSGCMQEGPGQAHAAVLDAPTGRMVLAWFGEPVDGWWDCGGYKYPPFNA